MSTIVYDGFNEMRGGMNGDSISSEVGEQQYLKGINVTCRGGIIRTRPPFMGVPLTFANFGDKRIFQRGKFQGACAYQSLIGTYLVVGVSGNVFMIEPDTGKVANVTVSAQLERFNQYQDRLYFCQVERYMIVQDGVNIPVIIEGLTAAKANHTLPSPNQVPTGTVMAYGHGRLFIKVDQNTFYAGDINQPTVPTAVLQFTELQTEVAAFSLPGDLGEITGMAFVQNFATGDGAGPLIVFAKNGFDAFAVYNPRSFWGEQDISQVQARGVGLASATCVVVTGDDIILRTYDGIGSYGLFKTSDRRFLNMSQELLPFESQETGWTRALSSGVLFDNRVLFTLVAEKVSALALDGSIVDDYRFKGLGSLDLAPLNGLTEISQSKLAVYDGVWTGPHPTAVVTANIEDETRCFVFGKTNEGVNVLYELMKNLGHDCGSIPINCRLYPKEMSFLDYTHMGSSQKPSDTIHNLKRLAQTTLFIQRFRDDVEFKFWVSPDRRCDFTLLSKMSIHAPMISCEPPYINLTSGQTQGRFRIAFPQFKDNLGDPVKGINLLNAHQYEFCLEWNGIAEIRRMGVEAEIQDTLADIALDPNKILPLAQRDDFDYEITCPEYEAQRHVLFSTFGIRRGRFDAWELMNLPDDVVAVDQNGQWYYPNDLGFGDDMLTFAGDPVTSPDWYTLPTFPGPTVPGAIAPTTAAPAGSPTVPAPVIRTPDGHMTVGGGPNDVVPVETLPKPGDPPTDLDGVCVELSVPGSVERGKSFLATIRLRKYRVKYSINKDSVAAAKAAYDAAVATYQAAKAAKAEWIDLTTAANAIDSAEAKYLSATTYDKTIFYEDYIGGKGISAIDLKLTDADHTHVGIVNGDFNSASPADYGTAEGATLTCIIEGGTQDVNDCFMFATVAFNDSSRASVISDDQPIEIAAADQVFFGLDALTEPVRGESFVMQITAYHTNGNIFYAYNKALDFTFNSTDPADIQLPANSLGFSFSNGVMMIPMIIEGGQGDDSFTITATEHGGTATGEFDGGFGNVFIITTWGMSHLRTSPATTRREIVVPWNGFSVTGSGANAWFWANDPNYTPSTTLNISLHLNVSSPFSIENPVPAPTALANAGVTLLQSLYAVPWEGGKSPGELHLSATESVFGPNFDPVEVVLVISDPSTGRTGMKSMTLVNCARRLLVYVPDPSTPDFEADADVATSPVQYTPPSWWMYPITANAVLQYEYAWLYTLNKASRSYVPSVSTLSPMASWEKLKPADGDLESLKWRKTLSTSTDPNAYIEDDYATTGHTTSFVFGADGVAKNIDITIKYNGTFVGGPTSGGRNKIAWTADANMPLAVFYSCFVNILNVVQVVRSSDSSPCDVALPLYGGYSGGIGSFVSLGSGDPTFPNSISVPDDSHPGHPYWVLNQIIGYSAYGYPSIALQGMMRAYINGIGYGFVQVHTWHSVPYSGSYPFTMNWAPGLDVSVWPPWPGFGMAGPAYVTQQAKT